ncbi:hypothetical protein SPBR_06091 [Sporothrix brasiliensis 5110]|uniref:Uncharacterized protein n=1 Tax=Sporothrix brasiliensis 5110 TaxID=1398154 RepID=A0A0C2JAC4_9PEZI|nr:uncharacterized protein SPBR_06091 [Sporothrix brasiliensis 5110]KIH93862.1 hypothetical protein SPBR_06091 [Sporothrix brasiliensis 5110]
MTTNPYGRLLARDVFLADLRDPGAVLGGLVRTPGVTNKVLHTVVCIAFDMPDDYAIQDSDGRTVDNDDSQLATGHYLLVSDRPVRVSQQQYFTRSLSIATGPRLESFKQQVRARDGRCVVSKVPSPGPQLDIWVGFETAHIVPLAYNSEWNRRGFPDLVSIPPPPPRHNDTINSVQNGLLLQSSFHALFDSYNFSILPDDNYKIVFFTPDVYGLAGTYLDRELLDDERRPLDAFLRWHFEQAVLCNVRGSGEPAFDQDFPPQSDMMADIMASPKAAERMEFELFTRLGASQILSE